MDDKHIIKLFKNPQIRTVDDLQTNQKYYSVLDTIKTITNCDNPKQYWKNIVDDGILFGTDLTENCKTFEVTSSDGKSVKMEFATREQILRIICSIPSAKAESYKEWLSFLGNKRISEFNNPQITIENHIHDFRNPRFGEEWISQKFKSIS